MGGSRTAGVKPDQQFLTCSTSCLSKPKIRRVWRKVVQKGVVGLLSRRASSKLDGRFSRRPIRTCIGLLTSKKQTNDRRQSCLALNFAMQASGLVSLQNYLSLRLIFSASKVILMATSASSVTNSCLTPRLVCHSIVHLTPLSGNTFLRFVSGSKDLTLPRVCRHACGPFICKVRRMSFQGKDVFFELPLSPHSIGDCLGSSPTLTDWLCK